MEALTAWILDGIRAHGAASVFVGVLLESLIAPIPSPLIIMGAGFLLIPAGISVADGWTRMTLAIVIPGSVASTLGAYLGYGVGYLGGKPLVERCKRFFGVSWEDLAGVEKQFGSGREGFTLFVLRAVPVVPLSVISLVAGLFRMRFAPFTIWTFLGAIPRCYLLAALGWWTGEAYSRLAHRIDRLESLVTIVLLAVTLAFFVWLRRAIRRRLSQ